MAAAKSIGRTKKRVQNRSKKKKRTVVEEEMVTNRKRKKKTMAMMMMTRMMMMMMMIMKRWKNKLDAIVLHCGPHASLIEGAATCCTEFYRVSFLTIVIF